MKIILVGALLIASFVQAHVFQVDDELLAILDNWEPISISQQDDTLVIILNERRITKTIYRAVITSGVCIPLYLGNKNYLDNISEISVINQFSKQGYIFENPKEACTRLGDVSGQTSEVVLYGNSRIY